MTKKKILIIDGYNVLRSGFRYTRITSPDYTDEAFNNAREQLIDDVIAFAESGTESIIVFDGGNSGNLEGSSQMIGPVKLMFSPTGQSADRIIERLAHDGREANAEVLVVTSDATIQDTVFGGGVTRMSADGFSRELEAAEPKEDYRVIPNPRGKRTLSERIAPDMADALVALRDELMGR